MNFNNEIYFLGPHREMAVDCPDNFIARNKTPPRYPPPRPPQVKKKRRQQSFKKSPQKLTPQKKAQCTTIISTLTTTTLTQSHNTPLITTKIINSLSPTHSLQSLSPTTSTSSLSKPPIMSSAQCSQENSPLPLEKFHFNSNLNNTLPKCSAKLMQNNTKFIINYNYSEYETSSQLHQQLPQHLQHPLQQQTQSQHDLKHLSKLTSTTSPLYTTCSLMDLNDKLNDTAEQLQLQNAYNTRQQLKLDQIENYENCLELEYQSQKLNNALTLKASKTSTVTNNPNGGIVGSLASTPDDLELMVDSLYRKSSSSSSYESELLSKKSCESYDSISYRQLNNNNNNNHLNNKSSSHLNSNSNNSSSASSSSHTQNFPKSAELMNNCHTANGSGDSLTSMTSTTSTPPPEYELKEFSSKNPILPPLIKHRELPVDVPDSFIEIVKTPPRYPPPAHLSSLSSQISSCSSASTANTTLTRINSCNNSNTESHNMSFSPESLKNHHIQQQQETSLISTMSLNGSFEEFQQQQQQQQQLQGFQQMGNQKPQPQVAGKRLDEVCFNFVFNFWFLIGKQLLAFVENPELCNLV